MLFNMVETQFKWDKFAINSDKYLKSLFIDAKRKGKIKTGNSASSKWFFLVLSCYILWLSWFNLFLYYDFLFFLFFFLSFVSVVSNCILPSSLQRARSFFAISSRVDPSLKSSLYFTGASKT